MKEAIYVLAGVVGLAAMLTVWVLAGIERRLVGIEDHLYGLLCALVVDIERRLRESSKQ